MAYTVTRINAVLQMRVRGYFVQGRRGWVRLRERGGKEHEAPCPDSLGRFLNAYIAADSTAETPDSPLSQKAVGRIGNLTGEALCQWDAYCIIQRWSKAVGMNPRIGKHAFRATGITAHLNKRGTLETAQHIANHESPP